MSRYLLGLASAGALAVGQLVVAQAYAGDGQVIILREVPYQLATGVRHTGRVSAVNVSPESQVRSMLGGALSPSGNAVTELTDRESSAIAGRVQSGTGATASGLQNNLVNEGLASRTLSGVQGSAFAPTGALGSLTAGIGAGVGGSVGRATDALSNTLNGTMLHAGGMK